MKLSRIFVGLMTGVVGVATLAPSPAQAIVKGYNLSWEGDGGYSMEGMFSFDDATLGPDMLVRESDLLTFMVDFFDPTDTVISSYDLTNQFNDDTRFRFNFNFEADTGIVRQSGIPGVAFGDFGIIIGDFGPGEVAFFKPICGPSQGLFRAATCATGFLLDEGGEVIATPKPVPEPVSLFGLGLVAGLGTLASWKKRDIASKTEK